MSNSLCFVISFVSNFDIFFLSFRKQRAIYLGKLSHWRFLSSVYNLLSIAAFDFLNSCQWTLYFVKDIWCLFVSTLDLTVSCFNLHDLLLKQSLVLDEVIILLLSRAYSQSLLRRRRNEFQRKPAFRRIVSWTFLSILYLFFDIMRFEVGDNIIKNKLNNDLQHMLVFLCFLVCKEALTFQIDWLFSLERLATLP